MACSLASSSTNALTMLKRVLTPAGREGYTGYTKHGTLHTQMWTANGIPWSITGLPFNVAQ